MHRRVPEVFSISFLTRFSEGNNWLLDWGMSADGRAGVNNFFCAQLLLHFSMDFEQTFTEALLSSALAHIVGVSWLDNIWPNYGPMFFFPYIEYLVNNFYWVQLLHFSTDFDQTFTEALLSSALAHIVGVSWLEDIWPNYGPLFFFLI
jgi:hypothetical protein